MTHLAIKSIIILSTMLTIAEAARILGVFPHPSRSHQVVFRSLTIELARKGHELIVFTTDPVNDSTIQNYTEVDLNFFYDHGAKDIDFYSKIKLGFWTFLRDVYQFNEKITDGTLSHPVMQRLISPNSTEKFDLIIVQCLFYDAFYALSIRFNAPLIGISSVQAMAIHHYIFGSPLLLAYSPDLFAGYSENMNFWQRLVNAYYHLRQIYEYQYIIIPEQEKISRKYFGDSVPPVHQLASNISLLLVNSHPFFAYSRPNIPAILYIGGFHVSRQKKKLPEDLEEILDNAKEGYIYFSLGSNIKSNCLPLDRRNMLLKTFEKLPYKVLWKFESDYLENQPSNVIIKKWWPQQEILAHPNIRLFIYQGGLHSTDEAIENGVPLLGFPMFSDQAFNMNRLRSYGAGKILNIVDTNEETFREAILEVITNSSYKENVLKMRNLFHDLPYDPMDNAVWWTEHVIRHKGAPHLRNKSRDMPWYQVQILDIITIIFLGFIIIISIIMVVTRCLFKKIFTLQASINLEHYFKKIN